MMLKKALIFLIFLMPIMVQSAEQAKPNMVYDVFKGGAIGALTYCTYKAMRGSKKASIIITGFATAMCATLAITSTVFYMNPNLIKDPSLKNNSWMLLPLACISGIGAYINGAELVSDILN